MGQGVDVEFQVGRRHDLGGEVGLLGTIKRTDDREAIKPYMYVHAKDGKWAVLHNPLTN